MKIGIVTFHAPHNFGSALQAFALQSLLTDMGHDAQIIDYLSADQRQYELLNPLHPRHCIRILHNYGAFKRRANSFKQFSQRYFHLTEKRYGVRTESKLTELTTQFDCFICGSDQIWNLDCTQGVVRPFFLSFAGDKHRIAYAPSLAHTSFKPENFDKKLVSELLSKFDFLSVREEETVPLFQPLVDKPIDVVLDPTLLLDADDYKEMALEPIVDEGYIFMYLLRSCPELIESTISMAQASGMKVVYVSERNLLIPNSINLFGVGPEEFVSLIAHAQTILTNSFHATVSSVLFHKPFRVFATDESGARMRDLLGNLGLSHRCVDRACSDAITGANWPEVDKRLNGLREHSWAYLRKALA